MEVSFSPITIYDCKRLFTSFRGKRSERKVKERVKFKGTIFDNDRCTCQIQEKS